MKKAAIGFVVALREESIVKLIGYCLVGILLLLGIYTTFQGVLEIRQHHQNLHVLEAWFKQQQQIALEQQKKQQSRLPASPVQSVPVEAK